MTIEAMHNNVYANQSVGKSSKWMIRVAPKGTTGQTMMNRQVTQPIWKTTQKRSLKTLRETSKKTQKSACLKKKKFFQRRKTT